MAGKVEDIEKRIEILNSLVAGSVLTDDIITSLTTRDGLLDALLVLYEECSHDYLVTKNKHVAAFVRKCKNKVLSFVILFHILLFEFIYLLFYRIKPIVCIIYAQCIRINVKIVICI